MSAKKETKKTTAKSKAKTGAKKPATTPKPKKEVIRKKFQGVVSSDLMDKTVVVRVDTVKVHSKYMKRYTSSRKYKVHDENNSCKVGDKVSFVECRPMSKDKRWRVVNNGQ